ncbi:hypothetical protein QR680_005626 [Steinernema hermaphroditum]|uniref:Bromodomain associated domain-containing protein n=1 Tax=Steinernema hermaphroditum TaxID=289476 RepID=A0AA39LW12_9BILA|nr:hypothetical protein QR680_005626 [Steinernema hermaphroditum]
MNSEVPSTSGALAQKFFENGPQTEEASVDLEEFAMERCFSTLGRDADLFSGEQQLLSRAQNLTSTEIFFDPVLLHSIELQRFCRSEHKSRYPPIPVENTSKRPPDPNRIEVQHLPSLNEGQCAEVTRSAIFLLAQHVGYDELSVDVVNTLFAVMDSHLTDMMDFYAVCQQRRRDKLSCAFKTNVAQQVLSMFNIRYPGVLRDYYNASVRQVEVGQRNMRRLKTTI